MGVISCWRQNCKNIKCDIYVHDVGYVCSECQSEFKRYLQEKQMNPKTEEAMVIMLDMFMATEKDTYTPVEPITVDEFFAKHTVS